MSVLLDYLNLSGDSHRWLMFLLDVSWKSSLLLLLGLTLSRLFRRASASTRHLIWSLTLMGVLLMPFLTWLLPAWQLAVLPEKPAPQELPNRFVPNTDLGLVDDGAGSESMVDSLQSLSQSRENAGPNRSEAKEIDRTDNRTLVTLAMKQRGEAPGAMNSEIPMALMLIWAIGSGVVFVRLLFGRFHVWWIAGRASQLPDSFWIDLSAKLSHKLGLVRAVKLLQAEKARMPMTWGIVWPKILLPAEADEWPEERKRFVLLHELAHVKQLDSLTQLLGQLGYALYWFNPLIWFANRELLKEREHACDDYVLSEGSKAAEYASLLLDLARSIHSGRFASLATVAMARRSQLEGRMIAILDPGTRRGYMRRYSVLLGGLVVMALSLPLAAMRPVAKSPVVLHVADAGVENANQSESQGAGTEVDAEATRTKEEPVSEALFEGKESTEAEALAAVESVAIDDHPEPELAPFTPESHVPEEPEPPELANVEGSLRGIVPEGREPATVAQEKNSVVVRSLIEALRDPILEVRMQAAMALGDIGNPSAVPALGEALKDESWQMRLQAAKALREIDDPAAIPVLREALNDENSHVRSEALAALGSLNDPTSIDAIAIALKDSDFQVRQQAAEALGDIDDPAAVAVLANAVTDEHPEVRKQVVQALAEIRDRSAIDALSQALKDTNWEVRSYAAQGLGEIRDPSTVGVLAAAIHDSHWEVRRSVVRALGELKDRRSVPALSDALKDSEWSVRKQAASSLGEIEDPAAIDALAAAAKGDANTQVRITSVWALGEIQDVRAITALADALQDENWEVRMRAAYALGKIDNVAAVDALTGALSDENVEVRQNAIWALGEINDYRAAPALISALNDPVWEVRKKAARAVGEIGNPVAVEALIGALGDQNSEVRTTIIWALGEIKDRKAVDPLIGSLSDPDWEVRKTAIWALGEIGDQRALEPLTQALKDENQEVRKNAARALGELKWRE